LPGNALFDEASAQIGVDHASLRPFDGLTQTSVCDPLATGKPREPSRFEDPHVADLTL
jgi:hypothetical protein